MKVDADIYGSHKPYDENHRVSRLRENLTSGSDGEGQETGQLVPRLSFTRQVFFKEAKQLLGLGRCQSNDFDAQIADTTITMIHYILLTMKFRFEHYETKGALFDHIREGIIESRLNERLWGLFIELIRVLEVLFDDVDQMDILQRILEDERAYEMICRLLPQEPDLQNAA